MITYIITRDLTTAEWSEGSWNKIFCVRGRYKRIFDRTEEHWVRLSWNYLRSNFYVALRKRPYEPEKDVRFLFQDNYRLLDGRVQSVY